LALAFLLAAAYLFGAGVILLFRPGTLAMAAGSDLLSGLETAGPIMFLIGLARRAAILIAVYGGVMAVPVLSSAATGQHFATLVREGIPFILRVLVVFFLLLGAQIEAFKR
jgi:hypothetical protein